MKFQVFKQKKKIAQVIDGKNYKITLDSDVVTFFNGKKLKLLKNMNSY